MPGYTRRQIELYYREAEQLQRDARADMIDNIQAAFSKESKVFVSKLRGY